MGAVASIRSFGPRPVAPDTLDDMIGVLRHRGRTTPLTWRSDQVHLACLPYFSQVRDPAPLASHGGRWIAALDGVVVNGRRLKSEYRLDADSNDTVRLLLEGLTVVGISFTERLEGQFAVVAHDLRRERTYLARDRIGIQPLFFARADGAVLVASEIKALLAGLVGVPGVDQGALSEYLVHGTVAAPRTMFQGVRAVEPGTRVEIGPHGTDRTVRYWAPPDPDPDEWWTVADAVDTVDAGLRESIRGVLAPDRRVGACLSRGIDSNLVAHVLARETGGPIHTFSARIAGSDDTATWVPEIVSRALGATHHAVPIGPTDLTKWWASLSWHRDAPLTDPTDIAVYLVSRTAADHVDLLLTGEGGDELFGGYRKYRLARAAHALDAVPASLRARLARSLTPVFGNTNTGRAGLRLAGARNDGERLEEWGAAFSHEECAALLGSSRPLQVGHSSVPGTHSGDLIARMQRHDLGSWLPAGRLERDDRMSMAASFMLRPALLDDRLVHASMRIPSALKVRHGHTKWVLKEVARRYLPDELVDRPRVGFRVPLAAWFRGPLREETRERLTGPGSFVADNLEPSVVQGILRRHEVANSDESHRLWTLLALDIWHATLTDRVPLPTPALTSTDAH